MEREKKKKQRTRRREEGERGGGFKAADAWYDRGSTYELPPLSLSVDGITRCDCIMCFTAQPQIPSGGACQIKSVRYLNLSSKKIKNYESQMAGGRETRADSKRRCETIHFRTKRAGKGKWWWGKCLDYPPPSVTAFVIITSCLLHLMSLPRYVRSSSPCISLPSWRGQGNQKANGFLWRKQRKANTPAVRAHSCAVL